MVAIDTLTVGSRAKSPWAGGGFGVSEVVALKDHGFVVDERDGRGWEMVKGEGEAVFDIDLNGAVDVTGAVGRRRQRGRCQRCCL